MTRFRVFAAALTLLIGSTVASAQIHISGSGATFPQPLYERWVAEYQKTHTNLKIDYGGGGSGKGIKDISASVVDFAGSDAPMTPDERKAAGGDDALVEFPTCAGGVVPAYNVPGLAKPLQFDGPTLADIYMGKVTNWNDPEITALNPGVQLPATAITPAYRSDGSGTNFVFTSYLSTQSPDFKKAIGASKQVQWPVGQGGNGNPGVAAIVKQTVGAIGYLEQNFADQNKIEFGLVKNKDGNFIKATPEAVSIAGAEAAKALSGNLLYTNLWNQPGEKVYPVSTFTYIIVYKDLKSVKSKEQAQALVDFLWWAMHDGQKINADIDYAPLNPAVQDKVDAALKMLTYKGEALTPAGSK
jgi:phosphate transport system substrate-binding protein